MRWLLGLFRIDYLESLHYSHLITYLKGILDVRSFWKRFSKFKPIYTFGLLVCIIQSMVNTISSICLALDHSTGAKIVQNVANG
jgi:hypothetical protein